MVKIFLSLGGAKNKKYYFSFKVSFKTNVFIDYDICSLSFKHYNILIKTYYSKKLDYSFKYTTFIGFCNRLNYFLLSYKWPFI